MSEQSYLNLLSHVIDDGEDRPDRTQVGTRSLFGPQLSFDMALDGFPLLTTKRVPFKHILTEVLWFISGATDTSFLKENNVSIWDANTAREFLDARGLVDYKQGELGPMYGYQWRHFGGDFRDPTSKGVDQLQRMLDLLRTDPTSRRIFMSAWNATDLDKMALEPCHVSFQLYLSNGFHLDGKVTLRSNDLFLGAPWNIAGYALLLEMFAHLSGYSPGRLIYSIGDAHVYHTHMKAVLTQIERRPRKFPRLVFKRKHERWEDFSTDSVEIERYDPHPAIKADMAI
jgi:thymidylate synthase